MVHTPFSPVRRSHWRNARRNRLAKRRIHLEVESLEDRTVMTSSPLAVVNSLPPSFYHDAFSFQIAVSGQSQASSNVQSVVQAPFVEVDLGRGIDGSALQAQCFGKPLPTTLVSFDAAGTPSVATHPLTGRPMAQDPDRADRTVAIVDCATLDPVARSISFTGARTNGEPLDETPVIAQGFVRVVPEGAVVSPVAISAPKAVTRELIVVNANVANADELLRSVMSDSSKTYTILRLDGTADGVQTVAEYLRETGQTFDAIHLLGHGADDEIQVGGSTLTLGNVSAFARAFATWGEYLSPDADILIYGCDVAASDAGRQLVDRIANLTGADVAASTDLTGSSARGGDWNLEYATGRIQVTSPFSTAAEQDWTGLLGVPPVQTYFVPMPEQNIRNAFLALYSGTGSQINSTISIATTSNNTVIYYDQAEDGYEADIANPMQSTTQIWGDGNLANGVAPGYATDIIPIGGTIVLNNLVNLPRDPATILYDGGDLIGATKAIAVTRAAFATNPGSVLATAVDVYDTSNYGTSFQAPVGQNTPSANGMFNYASLLIQASQDGTTLQIDKDGNGSIDIVATINKGQTYQVNGGVLQGATVTSNKPVQVQLMTGLPGATYESRSFTITPTSDWSKSYYSPVTTTSTSAPLAIFVYNPGASAITVNYQTQSGSGSFSVAAKGTFRYDVPQNSAVHFFTPGNQPFYAVGAMDSDASGTTYDWGFRLVPEANLTPAAVVGYGPGSSDLSGNGSPLWVTAVAATRIYVDFDGNPATGLLTDPNGKKYDQFFDVSALQAIRIFDPDKNLTGTRIYTVDGTLITAAWGEDPSSAAAGNPFLDMGTIIPPLPVSSVTKTAAVGDTNANGAGPGDTIQYHITVRNDGVVPLGNVVVTDIVPIGTTYVAGSTFVTGSSTFTGPVADQVGATTAFPLDNTGGLDVGLNIGNIPVGGSAVVNFTVTINNTGLPSNGIHNQAQVDSTDLSSIISVVTPLGSTPGVVVFGNASGSMTQAPSYNENAPLFLTVTDPDPNTDPALVNTITVTVLNPTTGDRENVTLTETGVNTGVFAATLASSTSVGQGVNDGTLYAHAGDTLTVTYTDPLHSDDTSSDTVPIVAPSLTKQLYLSDDGGGTGQNLDRVDPTKAGTGQTDTTASSTGIISTAAIPDTITVANTTSGQSSNVANGGTLTFAHDPGTGANRELIVAVSEGGTTNSNSAGTITGVTFGGVAMTQINTITSTAIKVYLFALKLGSTTPASGNVVVTVGTNASSVAAVATTFNNVDQTTPLGTSVTNFNAGSATGSVGVTSAAGELVYGVAAWDEGGANQSVTAAAGQTSLFNNSGFDFVSMSATTKAGAAGTVTSNWTSGDPTVQEYGAIGVSIKPSSTPAVATTTFTQTIPMGGNLVMPVGGQIRVVSYVNVISGSMPTNPTITATLKRNGTTFATLSSPVYDSVAGTLTWTGVLGANTTIATGETVTLDVTTTQAGVGFKIVYDDATHPSRIELPTTTVINVASVGVYDAPFVNDGNNANDGNLITTTTNGQTVYIRAPVTDPFNAADITSQILTITPPTGAPFTLTPISIIPTGTTNTKIYEYAWTTSVTSGNFGISVKANEGFENTISSTGGVPFNVNPADTGTPSITWFTDAAGNHIHQYAPNGTVYVQVTDIDQNTNPAVAETIVVTITTSGGDTQTLTLTETGVNTGVFRGSVPSSTTLGGAANDGTLLAPDPTNLFVAYTDPNDPTDQGSDNAIVRAIVAPNNPPVAINDTGTTNQNTILVVGAVGVITNDSDPDGNPLTVVTVNGSATKIGNPLTLTSGAIVTQNANGSYSYNPNGVFGYLAVGQTTTDSYNYTISDGNGGFATATVTITITGLNDPPVSTPLPPQSNVDSDAVLIPVGGSFTDPDAGDWFQFTAIGLPPGLSIDPVSGLITGTLTHNASQGGVGGVYTVTVTGADSSGSPTSQSFTWTVVNLAPIATNNTGSVTEDTVLTASGNMITDNSGFGVDSDPDGDPLAISQIQFGATVVSNPAVDVVGAYGSLNWNVDGTWTYTLDNANPAVQALNTGQTLTEVFTYTLSDGDGGSSTANLTITINGQDDPVTLAVNNVIATEGTDPFAFFTLSLNAPPTSPVSVNLALANVSATGGGVDYGTAGAGNLQVSLNGGATWVDATSATFAVGVQSVLVRTPIVDDAIDENTETFTLTATVTAGNVTNASATGTGTILDNDPTPSVTINDVTVNEAAGTATFTVTLSAASGLTTMVDFASAPGTATSPADFGAVGGTLTFNPGQTTNTIVVSIVNDTIFENSESYAINLTNATNATIADPTGVGTILDNGTGPGGNDNDTPTLSVSSVTTTEGVDPFAVFTVSLSNQSTQATTFSLGLTDVSATGGGVDYGTAGAGNLQVSTNGGAAWVDAASATIAPLTTGILVRTPIVDDLLDEPTETFTLTATVTAGTTTNPAATGTGTILDNDPTPSLTINDVTVNEAAGTATFTVTLSAPSGQTVTVNYATSDGTATAGADYFAVGGTLTFAPGATTQTIVVPILNDTIFENSESYNVNLSGATNATIADPLGVGTILDNGTGPGGNDDDTPSLTITNVTTTEGIDPFAVFTVSLSNQSTQATSFNLALASVSATGGGVDYGTAGAGNLQVSTNGGATWVDAASATIAPLTTSILVRTPIVDDLLDEATETFTLTATVTSGTTTNSAATGTGTILDNDPTPTLSVNDVVVNEAAGTATLTVSLSAASGQTVTMIYATSNGTAAQGVDYGAVSGTLTFAPGVVTQTIDISIVNDTIFENSEFFNLSIAAPTNATIADPTGTVTIRDNGTGPGGNDNDTPTLAVNNVTTTEGIDGFAVFTVSLSNLSTQTTTVDLALANVTAIGGGVDYGTAGAGNLQVSTNGGGTWIDATSATFAASLASAVLVRTPIVDDAINEPTETFTLTATVTAGTTTNPAATGTGTILDNDAAPSLTINDVTVNEAAGTATFTVTLSAPSGQTVTVNFATSDGTATAGADYTAVSGTLTFAPGATTQTIVVPILNDTIFENSEAYNVNLSAPTNATIADPLGIGTILDNGTGPGGNDNDTPTLSVSNVTTTEGVDPFAVFTVSLSNQSTQATSFNLALANVSATGAGIDYGTAGAGNLQVSTDGGATWGDAAAATIAPLTTSVLVRTPIVDDALNEATETFTLTATVTAGATTNPAATGTGTILDNDAAPSLTIDDVIVNEAAGTATFTVTLSAPSGLTVTVNYATSDGTATAGADYTAVSGTLTFAPGTTTQTIVVPILNDTIFENSEAYNVNLSAPTNATVADPLGVGTILDNGAGPGGNDNDTPTLSVTNVTTTEGIDPFAVFTVSLSNQSTQATTFNLALADVSANGAGVDYGTVGVGNLQVSLDGGLNWVDAASATIAPLSTSLLVRTPIVDDLLDEPTESFTLTATVTAGTTLNLAATGTGTILDNDPPPAISINDVTVNETAGTATFTVSLDAPSGQAVTVAYATANGTALSPGDYLATSGVLTFAPGVTTQTVSVSIVNDAIPEPTETFTVGLSAATNSTIADPTGVGTILDNDASIDKQPPAVSTLAIGDVATYDIVVTLAEGLTQNLIVTDNLPTGLTFTGFTIVNPNGIDNGGGTLAPVGFVAPTLDGQDAVFNFGNVTTPVGPAPNVFTIRLSARVSDIPGNTNGALLTNNANVQYVDGTSGPVTNPDPTPVPITVTEPQLSVVKTADDTTPHLGQTVTYTLTISHLGTSTANAYDLAVADNLPAGLTLVAASMQVVSAPAYVTFVDASTGNQAGATVNELDLGDTIVLSYQAIVSSDPAIIGGSFGGGDDSITNIANVRYDSRLGIDPNERTYNATGSQIVTVVGGDLAVTKTDGVASVTPGGRLTYTITVSNNGTDAADRVIVDDTLPARGATFNAALSTAGGTIDASGHLIYNLATLAAGASQTFTVVLDLAAVAPAGLDNLVNTVNVTQSDVDPTPGDNTATDTDAVNAAPDLVFTKDDGLTSVAPGDTITYTLTLRNAGNQDATGVSVLDTLPPNVTFVSASGGGIFGAGVVVWTIGSVAGGNAQTVTRTVTVRLNDTVPSGVAQLTNTAVAQDDGTNGGDPTPGNNTATDTDTVNAAPDIVVTKTDNVTVANANDLLTYVITVRNTGNQDARNVTVADTIPGATTFVSASNGGAVAGGVVTYPAFDLAAGATVTRTVVVRMPAVVPAAPIVNSVTANDDGTNGADPNPGNNTATDIDNTGPDLELIKLVTPDNVFIGRIVTYVFIINNLGPVPATGVFVDDPFPAGLEFVSAGFPTLGSFDVTSNRWTIGTMQPFTTERLTITARVRDEGPIVNNARTGLVEIDPDLNNNVSTAISVGMMRPASAISKRLFLSTPLFEDDLPADPAAPVTPAAAVAAANGFRAFPFVAGGAAAPANASPSTAAAAAFVADPNFIAPSAAAFALASANFGTPGVADDGAGQTAVTQVVSPAALEDLFGFDVDFGRRGRAFDFELPLTPALFEEGVEIYRDPSPIDGVFTGDVAHWQTWEPATQDAPKDVGFFGQEVLDEVGIPPIFASEETEPASLSAALLAAPLLMLAFRDEKEKTSRKTPIRR